MKLLISLFLILICSRASENDIKIPMFRNRPFHVRPHSGLYRIGGLELDDISIGNQIATYGDFNNDKKTDFVSLSDDLKTLSVYLYSSDDASFSLFYQTSFEQKILGVIPGDFNYDGMLDLLVVTPKTDFDPSPLILNVLYRNKVSPYFSIEKIMELDSPIMPIAFDAQGDRYVDLLFISKRTRYVTSLIDPETEPVITPFSELVSKSPECLSYSLVENNDFMNPHSNAFVDFNGDCAADLFLTTKDPDGNLVFEIWLRDSNGDFCLVDATKITLSQVSAVSIADMNNDGRLDLVYIESPKDSSEYMNLHVVYNQFPTDPSRPCKLVDPTMKSPFNPESYNMEFNEHNLDLTQITPINSSLFGTTRLFSPDKTNMRPPKIRLGDVNIDGNVDVMLVVANVDDKNPRFGSIMLGINLGKGNGIVFHDKSTPSEIIPYFQVNINSAEKNSEMTFLKDFPVLYASYFDFDEKGSLGLWMTLHNQNKNSSLVGIYNFVSTSNFILKTLGLNGNDQHESDDIGLRLGGVYHGSSVECIVNDVNGKARIAKAAQLGQTAYTPLELPYAFIGLGRTNNYVQDFTMGIAQSLGSSDHQQMSWTPIIPNSQLIVNTLKNNDWTLDVYVNPISQTMLVVMITLLILLVLAIVILILHLKEKREDQKSEEKFQVFA